MASYRYWRLNFTASKRGFIGLARISLRATANGSDSTGSGTASASSQQSGYEASKAVDGNPTTHWFAPSGLSCWWQYDFGSGIEIQQVDIAPTPNTTFDDEDAPTAWTLQGSNDGSSFTVVQSFTSLYQEWYADEVRSWYLPGFTPSGYAYRYWRLHILGASPSNFAGFAEIKMSATKGGANAIGSGTPSARTSFSGYPASAAVDGNPATQWASGGSNPDWWQYDFGSGIAIAQVDLMPRSDGNYPTTISFLASTNGVEFVEVYRVLPSSFSTGAYTPLYMDGIAPSPVSRRRFLGVMG